MQVRWESFHVHDDERMQSQTRHWHMLTTSSTQGDEMKFDLVNMRKTDGQLAATIRDSRGCKDERRRGHWMRFNDGTIMLVRGIHACQNGQVVGRAWGNPREYQKLGCLEVFTFDLHVGALYNIAYNVCELKAKSIFNHYKPSSISCIHN